MSRVTKRKHVMNEMFEDNYDLPKENQQIVRVTGSRGNNLHEVEPANEDENFLVSMPTKFRKNVWVKRGDFVLVEPIEEGDKVKAEIVRILTAQHVKEFTKENIWPKKFTRKREMVEAQEQQTDKNGDIGVQNLNRRQEVQHYQDTSTDSDETNSDDNDVQE